MLADSWQDQALNFDGTEYIEIPYSDKFNTPSITVEAWINTTMAAYGNIVDRDPEGAAGRQFQFRVTPTGKLEFISFIGGGANTTTGAITVNTGKWVHAAATYQVGTGTQSLWVNGLPDTSETKSGAGLDPETSTSAKLWIGTHGNATKTQKFTGFIAAASIYSRALSPQEIATLAKRRGIAYETNSRKISAKAPPTHVIAPRRTLTYPQLSIGRVAAYSAGEQGPGGDKWRDQEGTNDGGMSLLTWGGGEGHVVFDGTGQAVVGAKSILDFDNSFALSAWINPDAAQVNPDSAIVSKLQEITYSGYMLWFQGSGAVGFYINGGVRIQTGVITTGTWTHVAGVWDGTTVFLYVNGLVVASAAYSTAPASSSQISRIGSYRAAGNRGFTGGIDDINIYSRVLAPQEIATLAEYRGIAYVMSHSPRIIGPATPAVLAAATSSVSVIDTLGITDAVSITSHQLRLVTDTLALTDQTSLLTTSLRTVADTLAISDASFLQAVELHVFADTVGVADLVSQQVVYLRQIADTVGIRENLALNNIFVRLVADTLGISDDLARRVAARRQLLDLFTTRDDVADTGSIRGRSLTDRYAIDDATTFIKQFKRQQASPLVIQDSVSRAISRRVLITDRFAISDQISTDAILKPGKGLYSTPIYYPPVEGLYD